MTSFLLLCLIAPLTQDPATPPVAPTPVAAAPQPCTVVLHSGEELRGVLLVDSPTYLEIRVGTDTTVGIERANVKEVRREEVAANAVPELPLTPELVATPANSLAARDDWFVLHNGDGRCIGSLHASVQVGEQQIKLAQEWDFVDDRGRTQVTQLEALALDGTPATCFYHERTVVPNERVPRDERLLRGSYDGHKLTVVRTSLRGTEQVEHTVGGGLMLPVMLREVLRQNPGRLGGAGSRLVFDPARDELHQQDFVSGERRRVELEGKPQDVREIKISHGDRALAEWIDGSGRVLWREVNGPALVAVRAGKDVAAAMVANKAKAYPAAVLREAEGHFSLWLPNPIWRFHAQQTPGQVTAHAPLYGASASALVLDQLPVTTHIASAADTVERWLRVASRDLQIRTRQSVEVRGQPALLLEGAYRGTLGERPTRFEVRVLVMRTPQDTFLAICLAAPANDVDALRPDFERMVQSLELHPAAVAAEAKPGKHKIVPR